jgi:alanyl-tRNA synthetase
VTEKLYYDEPSLFEFDAKVIEAAEREGRHEVVLDRTCFYPGGGGQPCDLGTLGGVRVTEVGPRDETIVHVLEAPLAPGAVHGSVHGSVDAARRLDYRVQHTGQHIFSQALVRAGALDTVSVHFGPEDTTIEIAASSVDEATLGKAERIAADVIAENRRVLLHEVDPSEASRFPLRRTPPDAGRLRIIEVESFDWAACGGLHAASAGEIRLIKAVGVERIRGRTRIHVMIGQRAIDDYGRKAGLVQSLARALTCGEQFISGRVAELLGREKESARELRRLRLAQAAVDAAESAAAAASQGATLGAAAGPTAAGTAGAALCVHRMFDAAGPEYLKAFAEAVVAVPGRVVIAVDRSGEGFQWIAAHSLAAESLDLTAAVTPFLEAAGAKGGGRAARMQGVGARRDDAARFADGVRDAVRGALAARLPARLDGEDRA